MSAARLPVTLGLGLRLARAGGALRAGSIVASNAVGVILLLVAAGLPAAIYPDAVRRQEASATLAAILVFLLVPAVALLITAGRLSSGVRDRRLAALRMIGLPPHRVRRTAAAENGSLAVVGAVIGAAITAAVAPPLSRAAADGPRWLAQPVEISPTTSVLVAGGVVVLSVVLGTAATWSRELPGAGRSESVRRTPRSWRLVVLAAGCAMLVCTTMIDPEARGSLPVVLFLSGATVTVAGIVLVTPLVTAGTARLLARSDSTSARLAGRAVQTDPGGATRIVTGLVAAVFLAVGAQGVIGAFENTPQYLYATQMTGDGPQLMWLYGGATPDDVDATLDAVAIAAVEAVPGVHGVVPRYDVQVEEGEWGRQVFVGTCAQLALRMTMTGCDDDRAAAIIIPSQDEAGTDGMEPISGPELAVRMPAVGDPDTWVSRTVPLAAEPIVVDLDATTRTWIYTPTEVAFVPLDLVQDVIAPLTRADIIMEPGVAVRAPVQEAAIAAGAHADPYPTWDIEQVQRVRVAVWTLAGIALGVGLVALLLTAADRANERRRTVARQIMIGVPGRVLRAGQLLQVLVPYGVATALALACGVLLLAGYANLASFDDMLGTLGAEGSTWWSDVWVLVDARSMVMLGSIVVAGGLLVALGTLPLIRTRLTPELLRRE